MKRRLCLALALTTLGCLDLGGPSVDEVARVTDPTGVLDAVLIEVNGGATTSFAYMVFVVGRGDSARVNREPAIVVLDGAQRSERAPGATLRWAAPGDLVVEYLEAKHVMQRDSVVTIRSQQVLVRLRPGVVDSTAKPGGMR